ncbi:ATP-binding protein [Lyngbya confervoides]|uniref:histidine kinase n=1 Tax=Lyngbya confervoides BDU141951 TaxID=1574623 RepID=A0ABD4T1Q4_9CYAN|nr:ATP-binding protein [Lyngbya confervoides]MCM1982535.1 ATP-binding protein [Lyngbya confervoides BDU141951]
MVLIVDDCEEDREVYCRYLRASTYCRDYRYQVVTAESAEEGFKVCHQQQFDLVLLDYDLPDANGLEFLSQWQSLHGPACAVIMLTAYGNEAVAVKALRQGAQDYLVKQSLTPESLHHAIQIAFEQVQLRLQLYQSQERQRLIATSALRIRDSLDLDQILATSVSEIRQLLKSDRVVVYRLLTDTALQVLAESVAPGFPAALEIVSPQPLWPTALAQHLQQRPAQGLLEIQDVSTAPLDPEEQDLLAVLQVQSLLGLPIQVEKAGQSQVWGTLMVHQCQSQRSWSDPEKKVLEELCVHLAIAIQQSELLTQTQCALLKEQELNQFKSHIVATVSHEYRTPITSILASAATLERHGPRLEVSKQQRLLHLIMQQARHLRQLVDDMLVVNQVELGQIQFKPFPIDLEHFLRSLIEEYSMLAEVSHGFDLEIQGDCSHFWGDIGLLKQIFGNIISNALKYSNQPSPVQIRMGGDEIGVTIQVRDQGIGIPPVDLAQVFQSFSRGSNVDSIPGTGLGLSIAKACTALHQGTIALDSELGHYTAVTVWLPKQHRPGLAA